MNNRLAELGELSDEDSTGGSDVEMGDVTKDEFDDDDAPAKVDKSEATSAELAGFFKGVEQLRSAMEEISANIVEIKALYSELLTATSTEQGKELRDQIGEVRDRTNNIAQDMRFKLKSMKDENDKLEKSQKNNPAVINIRTNMHGSLVRKFLDLMQDYQQALSKFDQKIREKAYRQVQLVSPKADPADIDEMLEQDAGAAEQIFTVKIMEDRKHKNAEQTLNYLQEKQSDLHKLEQSIGELNQLFQDMAILVETQGDLIDQIEYSVLQSEAYTEDAVVNLETTEKIVNNTRRKKLYICVIVSVLIVILVVVVLVISGVLPPILTKLTG